MSAGEHQVGRGRVAPGAAAEHRGGKGHPPAVAAADEDHGVDPDILHGPEVPPPFVPSPVLGRDIVADLVEKSSGDEHGPLYTLSRGRALYAMDCDAEIIGAGHNPAHEGLKDRA